MIAGIVIGAIVLLGILAGIIGRFFGFSSQTAVKGTEMLTKKERVGQSIFSS